MGVQTDVLIADLHEAQAIADSVTPTRNWTGFTFNGFYHVQLCTLLSLLKTGSPYDDFERYCDAADIVSSPTEGGPLVIVFKPEQVAEVAVVTGLEDADFEILTSSWAATEEFKHWSTSDFRDLLRELGDLAETALLLDKYFMIWQSM